MRNTFVKYLGFIFLFLSLLEKGYAESSAIVITCASGELGSAIAKALARENNLLLTGRNIEKLEELQRELRSQYRYNYDIIALDYSDPSSLVEFGRILSTTKPQISGVVIITPRPQFGASLLQAQTDWMQLFQTTFTGPLEVLGKALDYASSDSKVVIIAGTTSVQLAPEYGPSCIVRRMWTTCAKALSHQLGPKKIHVNVLSPGVVLTKFHRERIAAKASQNGLSYDDQMKEDVTKVPLGRHALPEEVAQSVQFLLSKESDFINGVNLVLDGGSTTSY